MGGIDLLAELSKRRVFRVISGYAVVCFVILQIADVAFDPLGISDGVLRVVIAVMLLALPIVAYLSWIFDVNAESSLQRSKGGKPWLEASITSLALVALAVGAWFVLQPSTTQSQASPDTNAQISPAQPAIKASGATPAVRVELQLEGWEDWKTSTTPSPSMAISADGKNVVFVSRNAEGVSSLKVRRLTKLDTIEISGTQGAEKPFFSPDGKWVGYLDGKLMKRVALEGGAPSIITTVVGQFEGASWGTDNRIYYGQGRAGLTSTSVSEGQTRVETKLDVDRGEGSHRLPHYLPDHELLLFSNYRDDNENIKHETWVLNLKTGEQHYLFDGLAATYIDSGYITYAKPAGADQKTKEMRSGSLWAVPFDPTSAELTGPPQAIQNAVAGREGAAHAVSRSGLLIFLPKQGEILGELVLIDAEGERVLASGPLFEHPQFSNDGKSIAVTVIEEGHAPSVWVYGVDSKLKLKVASNSNYPLWGRNDQRLTFAKIGTGIVRQSLDNAKKPEVLVPHEQFIVPDAWINQNATLLYHAVYPGRGIFAYTLDASKEAQQVISQLAAFPNLSTDERWVAFCTWPGGIEVGSFPESFATTTLATSGCTPHWGNGDTRIYYQKFNKLWATAIEKNVGLGPIIGTSEVIADLGYPGISLFDVDPKGRIVITRHRDTAPADAVLLINWESELD